MRLMGLMSRGGRRRIYILRGLMLMDLSRSYFVFAERVDGSE